MSELELHSQSDSSRAGSDLVGSDDGADSSKNHSFWVFEYLPAELLQKIFSYFSHYQLCRNIAPVCRRWRDFAYDPIHWQKLALDCSEVPTVPDNMRTLLTRTRILKHLVISANSNCISNCLIDDPCFFNAEMPCLKELHLRFFKLLDLNCLKYVLQKVPYLEHLNIEGGAMVDDSCLEEICLLDKLKALNMLHCERITDAGLMLLVKKIKCLNFLNIDGIASISERSVESLAEMHFQHLQQLYLDGDEMSDLRCLSRCSSLQTLSISFSSGLDDSFLPSIMKLSNLEVLRLAKSKEAFSRFGLRTFFEQTTIKKLTSLDLSECAKLDDFILAIICSRYGQFLNKLVLSWCLEVTDIGLEEIVNNCRVIRHLNLTGLRQIEGRCFHRILDLMPFLTYLDLTYGSSVDDGVLSDLVCRKTDLTIVNYYGMCTGHSEEHYTWG